jgi:hypothetical protein
MLHRPEMNCGGDPAMLGSNHALDHDSKRRVLCFPLVLMQFRESLFGASSACISDRRLNMKAHRKFAAMVVAALAVVVFPLQCAAAAGMTAHAHPCCPGSPGLPVQHCATVGCFVSDPAPQPGLVVGGPGNVATSFVWMPAAAAVHENIQRPASILASHNLCLNQHQLLI